MSQRKRQDLQEGESRAGVGRGPVIFPVPPQGQQHVGLCGGLRLMRNAHHHRGRRAGDEHGAEEPHVAQGLLLTASQGWQGPGQGRVDGLLLQRGLCSPVGQDASPRAEDSLHRGTGEFAKEMCSFPRSHVAQILFVPLCERWNKAVCQGEYLFLHRGYHHLKHTPSGGTSLSQMYQKVIVKEKLSSSPPPLKAPGSSPHFFEGILSLLPTFLTLLSISLIKKYYFESL